MTYTAWTKLTASLRTSELNRLARQSSNNAEYLNQHLSQLPPIETYENTWDEFWNTEWSETEMAFVEAL